MRPPRVWSRNKESLSFKETGRGHSFVEARFFNTGNELKKQLRLQEIILALKPKSFLFKILFGAT